MRASPSGTTCSPSGTSSFDRAVVELRLEDDDRIRVADRGGEQPLRVRGRRRDRDLHARRVHVVRLRRVVVELGRADAAAVRHADRERERHPPARPPAVAADVVDELVERRIAEGVVLHLADGPPAGHAQADGGAEDPRLRERRVDAAVGAEALLEPGRRAEDAAEPPDVLAHDQHGRVALHLDVERVVHGLDEKALAHLPRILRSSARSCACDGGGSAYACSKTSDGSAGGSASAAAIPARMSSSASCLISSTSASARTPSRRR